MLPNFLVINFSWPLCQDVDVNISLYKMELVGHA